MRYAIGTIRRSHGSMSHLFSQLARDLEILGSRYIQQALWAAVLIVHILVGTISLLFGVVYFTMIVRSDWSKDAFAFVGLRFSLPVTVAAVILSTVCGIAHIVQAARALCTYCPVIGRRVQPAERGPRTPVLVFQGVDRGAPWCKKLQFAIVQVVASIGIRGRHFDTFFLIREVLTVALQSYLCHRLSASIVNEATLNASITLLVLNCASTPLIQIVGHRWHLLTRRLLVLVVDAVIDLMSSLIMPIALCLPYFQTFSQTSPTVHSGKAHDPIFIATARDELGIAIVNSEIACAMVYIPTITLLFCLSDFKALLVKVLARTKPQQPIAETPIRLRSARAHRVPHVVMMIYGAIIAVVTITTRMSSQREVLSICQVRLHPWSPRLVACGVVVIDCARENINGSADEIRLRLQEYDLDTIQVVTLAHCARLEMPPTLQKLPKLLILEVYNSTLVSWGHEAEIGASWHPEVMTVLILNVNLSRLGDIVPAGLLSSNIPESLTALVFANTFLHEIPEDFHLKWKHRLLNIQFNDCGLKLVPDGFSQIHVSFKISLSGNNLTSMSPEFFNHQLPQCLNLDKNPIQLPDVGNATGLKLLSVQHTPIEKIPLWVFTDKPTLIVGAHSPYCTNKPASTVVGATNVTCKELDATLFDFDVVDWKERRGLS